MLTGDEFPWVEAREVGDGDDVGGEGARERLAAEVVKDQLLVGGAEAEADGQAGQQGSSGRRLPQPPRVHGDPNQPKEASGIGSGGLLAGFGLCVFYSYMADLGSLLAMGGRRLESLGSCGGAQKGAVACFIGAPSPVA